MSDALSLAGTSGRARRRPQRASDRSHVSEPEVRTRTATIIERVRARATPRSCARAGARWRRRCRRSRCRASCARAALETLDASVRGALEQAAATSPPCTGASFPGVRGRGRSRASSSAGARIRSTRWASTRRVAARRIRAACSWASSPRASPASRAVILCSPPGRDGLPSHVVLAAAELAGVDEVYAIGGAGAIAAMAYGTAIVAARRRIVGPGNAYVAEAKLQVSGVTRHRFAGGTERAARHRRRHRATRRGRARAARAGRARSARRGRRHRDERASRATRSGRRSSAARDRAAPRDHRARRSRRGAACSGTSRSTTRSRSRTSTRPSICCSRSRDPEMARSSACATRAPCSSARRAPSRSAIT